MEDWHCVDDYWVGEREYIHNRKLDVAVVDVEFAFVAPEFVSFAPRNSCQWKCCWWRISSFMFAWFLMTWILRFYLILIYPRRPNYIYYFFWLTFNELFIKMNSFHLKCCKEGKWGTWEREKDIQGRKKL